MKVKHTLILAACALSACAYRADGLSSNDPVKRECAQRAQAAYDNATLAQHTHNGALFFGALGMDATDSPDNPASRSGQNKIMRDCWHEKEAAAH